MSKARTPLIVIFNSEDPASVLEVTSLAEKDPAHNVFTLADVATGADASAFNVDPEAAEHHIYVKDANGKLFQGTEAIEVMHDAVGLGGYFRFCRLPGMTSGRAGLHKTA